jgi:hypothetical protein
MLLVSNSPEQGFEWKKLFSFQFVDILATVELNFHGKKT